MEICGVFGCEYVFKVMYDQKTQFLKSLKIVKRFSWDRLKFVANTSQVYPKSES